VIIKKRNYCNDCGTQIEGDGSGWKTKCLECFKSQKVETVKFKDSKHPALIYDREHKEEPITPATPEHVEACLKELMSMVDVSVETPEKEAETRSWECEHVFVGKYRICDDCGTWEQQFMDSIDFGIRWSAI
jgi:hypothetical protein